MNGDKTLTANFQQNTGTFVDSRDNKTYKTVVIGGQKWMAENLNYVVDSSWCYENSVDICNDYGRLYNWTAAMTACPRGWHLPTRDEWGELAKTAGGTGEYGDGGTAGKKLKAKYSWYTDWNTQGNGTDDFGFSALKGGSRHYTGVFYSSFGMWWTATTESGSDYAYLRTMMDSPDTVYEGSNDKSYGFSVRCVAD